MSHPPARQPERPCAGAAGLAEPLLDRLLVLLELRPDDLLVQLGSTPPDWLLALTKLVPLRYQALVVDPSAEPWAPYAHAPGLRFVAMEPLRFAAYPMQCDRILLEDGLLQGDGGPELAARLFDRLTSTGRLLAVGAAGAPRRSRRGACEADGVAQVLEGAGFDVRREAAQPDEPVDFVLGLKAAPVLLMRGAGTGFVGSVLPGSEDCASDRADDSVRAGTGRRSRHEDRVRMVRPRSG